MTVLVVSKRVPFKVMVVLLTDHQAVVMNAEALSAVALLVSVDTVEPAVTEVMPVSIQVPSIHRQLTEVRLVMVDKRIIHGYLALLVLPVAVVVKPVAITQVVVLVKLV